MLETLQSIADCNSLGVMLLWLHHLMITFRIMSSLSLHLDEGSASGVRGQADGADLYLASKMFSSSGNCGDRVGPALPWLFPHRNRNRHSARAGRRRIHVCRVQIWFCAQDTVENKWGLRYHDYFHTGTETFIAPVPEGGGAAPFVPRTRAALLGSPHALVLVFRGSEPTNLINLRSSGRRGSQLDVYLKLAPAQMSGSLE